MEVLHWDMLHFFVGHEGHNLRQSYLALWHGQFKESEKLRVCEIYSILFMYLSILEQRVSVISQRKLDIIVIKKCPFIIAIPYRSLTLHLQSLASVSLLWKTLSNF